jgi:hypothetical protein
LNIRYQNLYKTEDLLTQSNEANKYSRVATIRSLGRNYIAQHRFKEALDLANKALAIGEGRNSKNYYLMSKWNWEILLRQKVECPKRYERL